jgi:hypothetical protein
MGAQRLMLVRMRPVRWLLVLLLAGAISAAGVELAVAQPTHQQPPPTTSSAQPSGGVQGTPQQAAGAQDPVTAPAASTDLERIRQAIQRDPVLKMEDYRLRFYVEIVAKWPTFQEYVRSSGADLMHGPVRGSGMTHQDFLGLVTPRQHYASSGGILPVEALQFQIVNWLGQKLARKAVESFRNARDESELRAIRERIEQELAALRAKGGGGDKDPR